MISFPTTLNKGGHYFNQPKQSSSVKDSILSALTTTFTNTINSSISRMTSGRGFDTDGIRYNEDRDYDSQIDIYKRNFTNYGTIYYDNNLLAYTNAKNSNIYAEQKAVESPFHVDGAVLTIINNYYATINDVLIETGCDSLADDKGANYTTHNYKAIKSTAPSLFNPYNAVLKRGITANVPLLAGSSSWETKYSADAADITNCSISELVRLSSQQNSILGQARYRYIDFMYCKDLGKISNNHLITLRKFAHPVGDAIFGEESVGEKGKNGPVTGDIGHLVAWFNTDDNKLEDILNYEYKATWKELQAKIDQKDSQEDDEGRRIIGKFLNMTSPKYNLGVRNGLSMTSWNNIVSAMGITPVGGTYANNDVALGRNYDANKVYTPENTVQDTHIYEGRLIFKHEFSLTFSYKLRAYSSINPKSAFLDLLGNIMEVTYHRGHFWKGKNQILGPQPNPVGWHKANKIIDSVSSTVGNLVDNLFHGNTSAVNNALASMGNELVNTAKNSTIGKATQQAASGDISGAVDTIKSGITKVYDQLSNIGVGDAIVGLAKNKLGRPALYAFDSLLPENNTGLWHVTIGNPKNPIMAFGNLILTDAKITHSGPLGLDDFPTELKVTVSLKHARGRDSVEIGKMYTRGENGLYISLASPYTSIQYANGNTIQSSKYDGGISYQSGEKVSEAQGHLSLMKTTDKEGKDNKDIDGNTVQISRLTNMSATGMETSTNSSERPYSLWAHLGCSAEQFAFNKDQLR